MVELCRSCRRTPCTCVCEYVCVRITSGRKRSIYGRWTRSIRVALVFSFFLSLFLFFFTFFFLSCSSVCTYIVHIRRRSISVGAFQFPPRTAQRPFPVRAVWRQSSLNASMLRQASATVICRFLASYVDDPGDIPTS